MKPLSLKDLLQEKADEALLYDRYLELGVHCTQIGVEDVLKVVKKWLEQECQDITDTDCGDKKCLICKDFNLYQNAKRVYINKILLERLDK